MSLVPHWGPLVEVPRQHEEAPLPSCLSAGWVRCLRGKLNPQEPGYITTHVWMMGNLVQEIISGLMSQQGHGQKPISQPEVSVDMKES